MASKRLAVSKANWKKLSEAMMPEDVYAQEALTRLKTRSRAYTARIQANPTDLPKIDFAGMKKRAPEQAAIFDALQKQYESIKIPYPTAEATYKAIDAATAELKANIEAEKKNLTGELKLNSAAEEKYAKMPPIEHMTDEEKMHYFPGAFMDPYKEGEIFLFNDQEDPRDPDVIKRHSDYKWARAYDEHGHEPHEGGGH
uniref:ATP synthase subunit d, mitochondrial n=1 Tax=Plectus sambesii TaxID=2011161 RepID=A0A914WI91_9BILA